MVPFEGEMTRRMRATTIEDRIRMYCMWVLADNIDIRREGILVSYIKDNGVVLEGPFE